MPFPSAKQLRNYYQNFNYKTGFITEGLIRKEAKQMLKILSKYKGELLDVGCGGGFYLDEAQKMGWHVTGVEMSRQLVQHARKILGLRVLNGEFIKVKLMKKFDVIIMSQVIEHLVNPGPSLNKIKILLKKNGVLYIATPNIESWLFKIQQKDFPYMIPPEHVYFYSPKSLNILLRKYGFKVNKLGTYGYQQDLAGIIKRLIKGKSVFFSTEQDKIYREYPRDPVKLSKYLLFDKLFCGNLFPLLNLRNGGSMIQVFATV